jgi:anti-anti-sigma factor
MAPDFSFEILQTDGTAVVKLTGELDLAVTTPLQDAMRTLHGRIVVDATDLTFMDAAGLRVLADAASRTDRFTVRHATGVVRILINICGFEHWTAERATSPHERRAGV